MDRVRLMSRFYAWHLAFDRIKPIVVENILPQSKFCRIYFIFCSALYNRKWREKNYNHLCLSIQVALAVSILAFRNLNADKRNMNDVVHLT